MSVHRKTISTSSRNGGIGVRTVLLRIQLKYTSAGFLLEFASICTMTVFSLYTLLSFGGSKPLSVTNALLYLLGLYSIYYLFFSPLFIISVFHLTSLGSIEEYIITRSRTRLYYLLNILITVFIHSALFTILILVAGELIFSLVLSHGVPWTTYNDFLLGRGVLLVREGLYSVHGSIIVVFQCLNVFLSLFAVALLLTWLRNYFIEKHIALLAVLVINYLQLLCHRMDIPEAVARVMPYRFIFIGAVSEPGKLYYPLLYWGVVIVVLTLGNIIAFQRTDILSATHEGRYG